MLALAREHRSIAALDSSTDWPHTEITIDALGAALPGKLDASEWDAAAIIALAEALEALRGPRL